MGSQVAHEMIWGGHELNVKITARKVILILSQSSL